ncbi:hypothetical protein [Marilutibacter alkalisoli]|uniref:Thioredoxin domain-containing protein n=1 Tax=Marilutibacter alkalisoli TaxID=2591633 RepID=A0A514BW98_9GAMM|nr:hypothetical protein [Lysobacter alkalisoli]QDH71640.1 hypothetical protein FKV23_01135 [Lysobacter alkalisoli]
MLVAIAALFLGSMLVAGLLRFSGWRPQGMQNHGELLQPPIDTRDVVPRMLDGNEYHWRPVERTWRILAAPPAQCDDACRQIARDVEVVWELFGKDADRVDVLWLGGYPDGVKRPDSLVEIAADDALRGRLPQADVTAGTPVYVLDPNGFVVLRYAPGFDPAGLRKDVARLLKLR